MFTAQVKTPFAKKLYTPTQFSTLNVLYTCMRAVKGYKRYYWVSAFATVILFGPILFWMHSSMPAAFDEKAMSHMLLTTHGWLISPVVWAEPVFELLLAPLSVGMTLMALNHLNEKDIGYKDIVALYRLENIKPILLLMAPVIALSEAVRLTAMVLPQGILMGVMMVTAMVVMRCVTLGADLALLDHFNRGTAVREAFPGMLRLIRRNLWQIVCVVVACLALLFAASVVSVVVGLIWFMPVWFMIRPVMYLYLLSDQKKSKD